MIDFNIFKDNLEAEIDARCEQGEIDSFSLQEEVKGIIVWDYFAEEYAKHVVDAYIGVEDSEGNLHFIEILNGKVIYKAQSYFHGKGKKTKIQES